MSNFIQTVALANPLQIYCRHSNLLHYSPTFRSIGILASTSCMPIVKHKPYLNPALTSTFIKVLNCCPEQQEGLACNRPECRFCQACTYRTKCEGAEPNRKSKIQTPSSRLHQKDPREASQKHHLHTLFINRNR